MKFRSTEVDGAFLLQMEPHADERGYFARTRSEQEFAAHGLQGGLSECSISANHRRGTLRGMHYQCAPNEETKLVSCVRGLIFDAIIDLRKASPTYMKTFATELSLENRCSLYIPDGVAHGFITLQDDSYVQYQISAEYAPESARGIRWNDPAFDIDWPLEPSIISQRDRAYEDFEP